VNPFICEVFARGLYVLGCDAQPRSLPDRVFVIEILLDRYRKPALGDMQVDRLVQPGAVMFLKHVFACDPEICCSVLNIGRHISRTHNDYAYMGLVGRQYQLAGRLRVFQNRNACLFQQRYRLFENSSLRQRQNQFLRLIIFCLVHSLIRCMLAPTADNFTSMRS